MITTDYHMHSSFSGDSDTPMINMINSARQKGLSAICFTEHMDLDFPKVPDNVPNREDICFEVDTPAYHQMYENIRSQYDDIQIRFGIELGLQPQLAETHRNYVNQWPFDFVIGSSHTCHKKDPYFPYFYEGRSEQAAYREYFESIAENIQSYDDFDVYGHFDYVVRYGPNKNKNYKYSTYADAIDASLKLLVEKGKGLEINTSGYRYLQSTPHPCAEILLRYRELGGEIITIGSDAHTEDGIAAHFDQAEEFLKNCGFKYITVFSNRKPSFIKL